MLRLDLELYFHIFTNSVSDSDSSSSNTKFLPNLTPTPQPWFQITTMYNANNVWIQHSEGIKEICLCTSMEDAKLHLFETEVSVWKVIFILELTLIVYLMTDFHKVLEYCGIFFFIYDDICKKICIHHIVGCGLNKFYVHFLFLQTYSVCCECEGKHVI